MLLGSVQHAPAKALTPVHASLNAKLDTPLYSLPCLPLKCANTQPMLSNSVKLQRTPTKAGTFMGSGSHKSRDFHMLAFAPSAVSFHPSRLRSSVPTLTNYTRASDPIHRTVLTQQHCPCVPLRVTLCSITWANLRVVCSTGPLVYRLG